MGAGTAAAVYILELVGSAARPKGRDEWARPQDHVGLGNHAPSRDQRDMPEARYHASSICTVKQIIIVVLCSAKYDTAVTPHDEGSFCGTVL